MMASADRRVLNRPWPFKLTVRQSAKGLGCPEGGGITLVQQRVSGETMAASQQAQVNVRELREAMGALPLLVLIKVGNAEVDEETGGLQVVYRLSRAIRVYPPS